jgi:hypothetical protein
MQRGLGVGARLEDAAGPGRSVTRSARTCFECARLRRRLARGLRTDTDKAQHVVEQRRCLMPETGHGARRASNLDVAPRMRRRAQNRFRTHRRRVLKCRQLEFAIGVRACWTNGV